MTLSKCYQYCINLYTSLLAGIKYFKGIIFLNLSWNHVFNSIIKWSINGIKIVILNHSSGLDVFGFALFVCRPHTRGIFISSPTKVSASHAFLKQL